MCKQKLVHENNTATEREKIEKQKFIEAVYKNTNIEQRHLVVRPDGNLNDEVIAEATPNPYKQNNTVRSQFPRSRRDSGFALDILPQSSEQSLSSSGGK